MCSEAPWNLSTPVMLLEAEIGELSRSSEDSSWKCEEQMHKNKRAC